MAVKYNLRFTYYGETSRDVNTYYEDESGIMEAHFLVEPYQNTNLSIITDAISQELSNCPKEKWKYYLSDSGQLELIITDYEIGRAIAEKYNCADDFDNKRIFPEIMKAVREAVSKHGKYDTIESLRNVLAYVQEL